MRSQSSNKAIRTLSESFEMSANNSLCCWCLSVIQWTEKKKTQLDLHFIYIPLDGKTFYYLKSMSILKYATECISPGVIITVIFSVARMLQGMELQSVSVSSSGSSRFMFLKILFPKSLGVLFLLKRLRLNSLDQNLWRWLLGI